jgi:ABC-type branched-subunit amino acid transport system ATPase component
MLLEVKDLHAYYGAIHALQGVSFQVDEGQIVTLIGANGAGKSTTLNTISGLLQPRKGSMAFHGKDLTRVQAQDIVRLGIIQVPEGRKIFATLTVMENLEMGAYTRSDKAEIQSSFERVFRSLPRLKERLKQLWGAPAKDTVDMQAPTPEDRHQWLARGRGYYLASWVVENRMEVTLWLYGEDYGIVLMEIYESLEK